MTVLTQIQYGGPPLQNALPEASTCLNPASVKLKIFLGLVFAIFTFKIMFES